MRTRLCVSARIAVIADLATSMEMPHTEDQDTAGLGITDEGCTYFPATVYLESSSGTRVSSMQEEIDAILLEHGFEESDEHRTPGGWEGVRSEDDRGATATVLGDGSIVRISVTVPVDTGGAPCEDSTLT